MRAQYARRAFACANVTGFADWYSVRPDAAPGRVGFGESVRFRKQFA